MHDIFCISIGDWKFHYHSRFHFLLQIFVWDVDGWGIQTCRSLQTPDGVMTLAPSDTHIQFHKDQTCFLLVHETHLAIYEAEELTCLKQVCCALLLYVVFVWVGMVLFAGSFMLITRNMFCFLLTVVSNKFSSYLPSNILMRLSDGVHQLCGWNIVHTWSFKSWSTVPDIIHCIPSSYY